jgi:hypothetical protein
LSAVTSTQAGPSKSDGERIDDAGDGGVRIAQFLVAQELI